MILGISQRKLLIAVIIQSETPALSKVAHNKSIWNTKSSGTYRPIMSNPVISTLISKWHVIWWVHPILWYSRPLPSNRSMCFLQLPWLSSLPIFFVLTSEGLATLGQPCGKESRVDPWQWSCVWTIFLFPLIHFSSTTFWNLLQWPTTVLHDIWSGLFNHDVEPCRMT